MTGENWEGAKAEESAQGASTPVAHRPVMAAVSAETTPQVPGLAQGAEELAAGAVAQKPVRYHPHHAFIWLGGLRTLFIALWCLVIGSFSGLASLFIEISENPAVAAEAGFVMAIVIAVCLGAILLIATLCFLVRWVQWRHFWYEFDPSEFSIYSGIISKKRTHVPYTRVQSVDQKSSLIQRVLGLCFVSIDTAGGANNKAITIPYVTKSQAEELRQQLYLRKAAMASGMSPEQMAAQAAAVTAAASGYAPMQAAAHGQVSATAAAPGALGMAAVPAGTCGAATSAAPGASAVAVNLVGEGNILDGASAFASQASGLFGGFSAQQEAASYEYGLSNKELVFTGLFNNTSFVIVAIGLLAFFGQIIQGVTDIVPNSDVLLESTVENMVARDGALMAGGIFAGAFLAIALVMWAFSAVATMLSFGGFKARRRGERIEVERGILQHRFQGVAVDRVQSVIVSQTLMRRLLGYCEISLGKIDALAGDGSDGKNGDKNGQMGKVVVHPFVKKSKCAEVIAGLIPEFANMPHEATPVAKVALRRAVLRRTIWQGAGFWIIVMAAIMQGSLHLAAVLTADPELWDMLFIFDYGAAFLYAAGAVCMVVNLVGAVLWARESSFAVNRRFMQVSNGGISRESVCFPRQKIQFGSTRTNPFQRMAKTATIRVTIAAGVGGTTVALIDVTQEDADRWLEWVEPQK